MKRREFLKTPTVAVGLGLAAGAMPVWAATAGIDRLADASTLLYLDGSDTAGADVNVIARPALADARAAAGPATRPRRERAWLSTATRVPPTASSTPSRSAWLTPRRAARSSTMACFATTRATAPARRAASTPKPAPISVCVCSATRAAPACAATAELCMKPGILRSGLRRGLYALVVDSTGAGSPEPGALGRSPAVRCSTRTARHRTSTTC